MTTSKHHGTALVPGASSGLEAFSADRLARRGDDLTLVAQPRASRGAGAAPRPRDGPYGRFRRGRSHRPQGYRAHRGGTPLRRAPHPASIVGVAPELLHGVYGGT